MAEDTDLAAWLFTVARNLFVRHRRWSMLDLSRFVALGEDLAHASARPLPDADAESSRDLARLERSLASLRETERRSTNRLNDVRARTSATIRQRDELARAQQEAQHVLDAALQERSDAEREHD